MKCFNYNDQQIIPAGIGFATAGIINHWEKLDDNQRKNYVITLAKSSDRAICLASNMLDLAYINSEDFVMESRLTDLGHLISEKCFEYNSIFKAADNVKITCGIDGEVVAICNSYYIRRILDNLLSEILDNLRNVTIEVILGSFKKEFYEFADVKLFLKSKDPKETQDLVIILNKIVDVDLKSEIRNQLIETIVEMHKGKILTKLQNNLGFINLTIPTQC
ncbi:MAG: hypothetical protein ACRYE9_03750 [Janthinobacterium lividum]